MRLSNISSIENATERFVEATQMLRAVANTPQHKWRLNMPGSRIYYVSPSCRPIYGRSGTLTSNPTPEGQPHQKVQLRALAGTKQTVLALLDSVTPGLSGIRTGGHGTVGFAQAGSQGQRDF